MSSILGKGINLGKDFLTFGASGATASQNKALQGQIADLDKLSPQLLAQLKQQQAELGQAFDPWTKNAQSDYDAMRTASQADLSQYDYDPFKEFDQSSLDKYLNPEIDYLIGKQGKAIENASANRGNLFSGDTAQALQDNAMQMAKADRTQAMGLARQDWQDERQYGQQAKDKGFQLYGQNLSNLQNLSNIGQNASMDKFRLYDENQDSYNQNLNNIAMQKSQINAQLASAPGFGSQLMQTIPSRLQMGASLLKMGK